MLTSKNPQRANPIAAAVCPCIKSQMLAGIHTEAAPKMGIKEATDVTTANKSGNGNPATTNPTPDKIPWAIEVTNMARTTADTVRASVRIMAAMLRNTAIDKARCAAAASDPSLLATDLADYLEVNHLHPADPGDLPAASVHLFRSGEKEKVLGLSNRHNRYLRNMLIESAWVAVRKDPALTLKYSELIRRMSKQEAIIRIAKKLLNRIRFVWKNNTCYSFALVA